MRTGFWTCATLYLDSRLIVDISLFRCCIKIDIKIDRIKIFIVVKTTENTADVNGEVSNS